MTQYELKTGLYISPTPTGAYYAVSSPETDPSRHLLHSVLQQQASPMLTMDGLIEWNQPNEGEALDLLYHMQSLGWVDGLAEPVNAPIGVLEDVLPSLLLPLSSNGKALLADDQGFYISSHGFAHETSEELSALSADIGSLYGRHSGLLKGNLGLGTSAWSLVDAGGNSQVGFWPMFIGAQRFVLVLGGMPRLNQPELLQLIWALSIRYGKRETR
ncbi:hypothetical protein MNBD_GAMMA13-1956 [hydrothermal vent metagenome]|uniref:Roadblock/LAMTOR2 domain-containing protein n=1 Tax=hydrothermal vent metagenome TaxID=652676 RepID=A0A3B0Z2Q9_9ZZZZ